MALTKKKVVYPSKTTLNLAMRRKSEFHPKRLVPLLLVLFLCAALFGKFAVSDRLQRVNEAQARLTALQSQKTDLLAATADYDEVAERYRLYSVGWMTEEEAALVDRVGMLDLIESELMGKGRVLGLTASGNLLSVQLSGITLDDTSTIVERLYQRDDVVNVSVYTATTAEETGSNAAVSLIVTMTAEGGEAE